MSDPYWAVVVPYATKNPCLLARGFSVVGIPWCSVPKVALHFVHQLRGIWDVLVTQLRCLIQVGFDDLRR